MSDKILFINFDTGNLIDNEGALIVQAPSISYKAYPSWEIHFVRVFDDGTLSGVDMTAGVSYNAAVDLDFNINTQPIIRTLDTGIDHTQAASGIFTVGLDAGTEGFLSAVNGRNTVQGWFEFRGYNSEDRCLYDYRIKCNCLGAIDPNSGEPLPVVSGGVTLADVYALLRSAPEYQYSDNGTNWHPTQQSGDIYYQTRYDGGDWSSTIEMIKGADGTDGEDGTDGTNGVGFKVVGEYNAGTTYHPYTTSGYYEVVTHNGSSYAYINSTASSGHEPSGTDSYWELIAAKGDTGSVDNITVSDITDFDSTMSGILSGYAKKGESYTIAQSNTLLAEKANASDVYTTEEADNKFVDIDELSEATGNLVTVSQWTNQNATFQGEINYLSGQISGGGGGGSGDLSNYYTKSEVNSISAYLQNEIDSIPSGGGSASGTVESINFNGESLLPDNGVITLNALPMATALPNPTRTEQNFCLYLGQNVNGDDYVGSLYAPDFAYGYTSGFNIPISSNISLTGTNRVWKGTDGMDMKWKVEYNNSAWRIYQAYDLEEPDPWTLYATQISAYTSGQPWGAYEWVSSATFHPHLIPANDFMDGKKGHLYEKEGDYDNDKLLITYMEYGQKVEVWLKRVYNQGVALDQWTYDGQPAETSYQGRIVRVLSTTGSPAGIWTYDDDVHTYETGSTGNTDEPWKFTNEKFTYHDSVYDDEATLYITIKRLFKGGWMDIGSMLH